jgi:hypothetical protein
LIFFRKRYSGKSHHYADPGWLEIYNREDCTELILSARARLMQEGNCGSRIYAPPKQDQDQVRCKHDAVSVFRFVILNSVFVQLKIFL